MRSRIVPVLVITLTLCAPRADALQFPGGLTETTALIAIVGVEIALLLPAIQEAREAAASGVITVGARTGADPFFAEETLLPGGTAGIFAADILDFDLQLTFPTDGTTGAATVRLTPDTGAIEVFERSWITDGTRLYIDTTGIAPGTPLVQFTVDKFSTEIGFPDGRRLGDDVDDFVLFQLFSGSLNLGVAAFPDGPAGDPAIFGSGLLTADAIYPLGNFAAVPVPPAAPMMLAAFCTMLGAARRTAAPATC